MSRPDPTSPQRRAFQHAWAPLAACLPVVLLVVLGTAACRTDPPAPRPSVDSTDTRAKALPRLLREQERASRFAEAVEATGLDETLGGVGPFTIFAPVDDAFARSGLLLDTLLAADAPDSLRKVVAYHLARGRWTAGRVRDSVRVATLLDVSVLLERVGDGSGLRVDRRPVLATIEGQNGVLHLLGGVLSLPQPDTADVAPDSLAEGASDGSGR